MSFKHALSTTTAPIMKSSSRHYTDFKRRQIQGLVTINLLINGSDAQKRSEYNGQPYQNRMGNYSGPHELQVMEGDFVFVPNLEAQMRDGRTRLPIENRSTALVSFNALPLNGARTRDEFNSQFRFMGIAMNTFRFNDPTQPNNGIAVQHRGATSTLNSGKDTFSPGDPIVVRVPPIRPEQRTQAMRSRNLRVNNVPGRIVAVPEAYSRANESMRMATQAIRLLFRQGRVGASGYDTALSVRALKPSSANVLDQIAYMAVSYKRSQLQTILNGVAVLEAYGIIDFKMPTIDDIATSAQLDTQVLNLSLDDTLNSERFDISENGTINAKKIKRTVFLQRTNGQLKWLATKLDLLHSFDTEKHKPSQNLIDAMLGVCNNTLLGSDVMARKYDIRRLLDPTKSPDTLTAVRYNRSALTADTYDIQLAKSQADSTTGLFQSAIEATKYLDQNVAGIALNESKPGKVLDILL